MSRFDEGEGNAPCKLGDATCLAETEKAIKVKLEDADEEFWVPKSVVHDDSEVYSMKNGSGSLVVKQWWAEKNGRA